MGPPEGESSPQPQPRQIFSVISGRWGSEESRRRRARHHQAVDGMTSGPVNIVHHVDCMTDLVTDDGPYGLVINGIRIRVKAFEGGWRRKANLGQKDLADGRSWRAHHSESCACLCRGLIRDALGRIADHQCRHLSNVPSNACSIEIDVAAQ